MTNKKEIETSINQLAVNGMYYREFNLDMIKDSKFADHIKLVHFIYDDNMIEDKEQWIQDLWNGI